MPVSRLTVPATISTPTAMAMVPRMASSRPPPLPLLTVVSTFHLKCGTARPMTPAASHSVGPITTIRQAKQNPQNTALATFRRPSTGGSPVRSATSAAEWARAVLMSRPPAAPSARPRSTAGVFSSLYASSHGQGRAGHAADEHPGTDVRGQRDDHEHQADLVPGLHRETRGVRQCPVKLVDDRGRDRRER